MHVSYATRYIQFPREEGGFRIRRSSHNDHISCDSNDILSIIIRESGGRGLVFKTLHKKTLPFRDR